MRADEQAAIGVEDGARAARERGEAVELKMAIDDGLVPASRPPAATGWATPGGVPAVCLSTCASEPAEQRGAHRLVRVELL